MTDNGQEPTPEGQEPQGVAVSEPEKPNNDSEPAEGDSELTKLRNEAAKWRVKFRDAEGALNAQKKAQTDAEKQRLAEQGQYEKLYQTEQERALKLEAQVAELNDMIRQREVALLRQQVASAKKLPPALAERLRGDTQEELEADADIMLAALPRSSAPSLDGNRSGGAGIGATITDEEVLEFANRFNVNPAHVDRAIVAKVKK